VDDLKVIQETAPSQYKRFIVDYPFEGGYYSVQIYALNQEEAQRRVQNLQYAKYVGELALTIPAWAGGRFICPVFCFFANLFRKT
jgi:hypothetical protein